MRATSIGHQRRADRPKGRASAPALFVEIRRDPRSLRGSRPNSGQVGGSTGVRPLTPVLAFFSFLVRPTDLTRKVKRQAPRRRVVSNEAVSSAYGLRAAPTSSPIL